MIILQDFDEIKEVGYRHGDTYFKGFKKAGLMRQFYWAKPRQISRRGSVFTLKQARRGSLYDVSNIGSQGSSLESSGMKLIIASEPTPECKNVWLLNCW